MSFDAAARRGRRMALRCRRPRGRRSAVTAADRRSRHRRALRGRACRCSSSSGPASTLAVRRPTSASPPDGAKLFVKALGADERSADLLFRLYRRLLPRDFGDEQAVPTLRRAVEHEAFVALAARTLGVRTPRCGPFATAEPNGYVLAYDAIDGQVPRPARAERDHRRGARGQLAPRRRSCGDHRIAHRDLRLANIFLDDGGEVWLIDFGFSEMAASDLLLATDVAELLASSSLYVGREAGRRPRRRHRRPGDLAGHARPTAACGRSAGRHARRSRIVPGCSTSYASAWPGQPSSPDDEPLVVDRRRRGTDHPVGVDRRRPQAGHRRRSRHACSTPSTGCPAAPLPVPLVADAARQPRRRHRRRAWSSRSSPATSPSPSA